MEKKNLPGNPNATVIKPKQADIPGKPLPKDATVIKTGPSLDTGQARALTEIAKAVQSIDNSVGFEKARQEANQALASNKILLNNRFVLEALIGGGGMGSVYKARDLRKVEANDPNPYVAVKVLNQDFQNHPDAFVTLQREASKSSTLAHPNIVTVHDFDRDGAITYMTMELLAGVDLENYIKQHQGKGVERTEALKIIKEYSEALIYAHKKNIIHSDFKPGNIFLTDDGAKVLDFGIARLRHGTRTADKFDAGKLGALTPAYASLEMIRGESADPADDVYAAAVIAYELLTGKHPYQRKPANEALAENLKVERIAGLKQRQWAALEAALALQRQYRTPTLQQFLNGMINVGTGRWIKVAAAIVLAMTVVIGYFEIFASTDLAGIVAENLVKGTQCHEARNYECAIESANTVLKLEPGNASAARLLSQARAEDIKLKEQSYAATATRCLAANDFDCARTQLASLRLAAPQSAHIQEIQHSIEVRTAVNNAEQCFNRGDYDCAVANSKLALDKDPADTLALEFARKLQDTLTSQRAKTANNDKGYQDNMAKAENCFRLKDYDCSISFAKQALTYKPRDVNGEGLVQKATYAKVQYQESQVRAKAILEQGMNCYKQKNFSCAIAKSESALEFVPGMKEAIRLKVDAQNEIAKLKGSIAIE